MGGSAQRELETQRERDRETVSFEAHVLLLKTPTCRLSAMAKEVRKITLEEDESRIMAKTPHAHTNTHTHMHSNKCYAALSCLRQQIVACCI